MNDHRFIELVNLYIDRQITAAETAELEDELQANPRRRGVYRQYCRMHRATKLVYENFRANAPEGQAIGTAGPGTIARFEDRASARPARWAYYAGGLAAAACFALVFARVNTTETTAASLMANLNSKPAASKALAVAAPAAEVSAEEAPDGAAIESRSSAEPTTDYAALLAIVREEDQRALANGRARSGPASSLFDDGVFESGRFLPANNQRVFRGREAPAQATESTSFQFQR